MRNLLATLFILITASTIYSQSHWEAIILANETWNYLPATSEPSSDWYFVDFDDSEWQSGPGGIGYADNDDATIVSAINSLYLRKEFEITDINAVEEVHLDIDYDDAFVAYLNGTEIARSNNVSESTPTYNSTLSSDHEALMKDGGQPSRFQFDKSILQNGSNQLSVHIINMGINSSDLTSIIYLNAKINSSDVVYKTTGDYFLEPIEYSSSTLPIIKINTNGQNIPDEPKITAHMGIINNSDGVNNINDPFIGYDGTIGIEIRGSSSQMFDKKNYGIETRMSTGENLDTNLLGMPKENDWVLHGPYSDKSLMRNALTFHLGNSLGSWSPRTRFCELYINDTYHGVYVLMEKIKRDKNRVKIAKLEATEISGDDLTGGYILKIDRPDEYWTSPYLGMNGSGYININYVYPKYSDMPAVQRNYIKNYVTDFEDVINSSDYKDLTNGYRAYTNVQSFVDYFIINELSKNVDAYRLSAYFHKDKDSKGGKITMGPLWDYNFSFGNADYHDAWNTEGWFYESVSESDNFQVPVWWERLMNDDYFKSDLKRRWTSIRQNVLSEENISSFIDATVTKLDGAQQRNFQAFPIINQYVWPNFYVGTTYQDEINFMTDWIYDRLDWMDNEIKNYPELETGIEFNAKSEITLSNSEVEIYPNPFSEHLILSADLKDNHSLSLTITNMLGQEVLTKQWQGLYGYNELSINGSEFNGEKGLYFYSVKIDNKTVKSGKLLKQ